jgi:hypothetical protein
VKPTEQKSMQIDPARLRTAAELHLVNADSRVNKMGGSYVNSDWLMPFAGGEPCAGCSSISLPAAPNPMYSIDGSIFSAFEEAGEVLRGLFSTSAERASSASRYSFDDIVV